LTRAEEVVPLGATLPGEDEFALNNGGPLSHMAGRIVLPRMQPFYDRFHALEGLSAVESARWEGRMRTFTAKLVLAARGRRLLLKSPGHMARVRHLRALFPGAKFVHISRPPARVFQSNINLWRTLQGAFSLQRPLAADEQEEIVVREFLTAEERYLADRASIPPRDLAEVRLQDLAADPIGELKRVYVTLDLPWSGAYERRLPALLAAQGRRQPIAHPELTPAQRARVARIEHLTATFGHDRPPIATVAPPATVEKPRNVAAGLVRGLMVAAACLAVWQAVDPWLGPLKALPAWPVGIAIGYAVLGGETARSNLMGAAAALLMIGTFLLHLWLGIGQPPSAEAAWRVLDRIVTTDRVIWGPIATTIAFWIGSGRPT
jgi:hypothetical protein